MITRLSCYDQALQSRGQLRGLTPPKDERDRERNGPVTPDAVLRFARLNSTEQACWLNLQQTVDLWNALQSHGMAELDESSPPRLPDFQPSLATRPSGLPVEVSLSYLPGPEATAAWCPHGTWRSPVAHLNGVQGVAGSNPAVPIW